MKAFKRILGAVVFLALLGGLLEAGFRRARVPHDALIYQDSLDPALRFELKPGAEGSKLGAWVSISSQGLREREISQEKPADEFRIAVVGDHPGFGLTVPVEKTFARLLENLVKVPAGLTLRTINLSNYVYGAEQKEAFLAKRGLGFQPDLVLFQVFPGDWKELPQAKYPYPGFKNFLRSHSQFLCRVMERLYWRHEPVRRSALDLPKMDVAIRRLKDLLRAKQMPALVLYVPDLSAPGGPESPEAKKVETAYREACRANGLPYIDMTPALSSDPPSALLSDRKYPYLNASGQSKVAQALASRLQLPLRRMLLAKQKAKPAGLPQPAEVDRGRRFQLEIFQKHFLIRK